MKASRKKVKELTNGWSLVKDSNDRIPPRHKCYINEEGTEVAFHNSNYDSVIVMKYDTVSYIINHGYGVFNEDIPDSNLFLDTKIPGTILIRDKDYQKFTEMFDGEEMRFIRNQMDVIQYNR